MAKNELKTLNYYNAISKGYKNLYHEEQKQKISKIYDYLPKEGLLLDLGSGDGVLNEFLHKKVKIISFDLSYELLLLNKNKIRVQGSAQAIPFKEDSFNIVSSFTMLQDLPEPLKALEEAKRVLKKNGIFILSFLKLSQDLHSIIQKIESEFQIIKKIEEEKDLIFVLKK